MSCPKCESDAIISISPTYPVTYQCGICRLLFIQNPKTFIDE